MDHQQLIAVRIKDGIFCGNATAAHDEDFLVMNKVTHIINCAGPEVRDLFEASGMHYLTFPWRDCTGSVCSTVMFDSGDRNVESTLRFVDKALEQGECVLIHSQMGISRAPALTAAFLMLKYSWNLDNTLKFMEMAHQDMQIKPYFMRQLRTFAKRHEPRYDVFDPRVDDAPFGYDNDQWMLRNTFVNGLVADVQSKHELYTAASSSIKIQEPNYKNAARRRRRITFCDTKQGTSVHSEATQPLAQPKISQYVDPHTGIACVVSRTAPNIAPLPSILARRGNPANHRLESPPDANPKGSQVLVLKQIEDHQMRTEINRFDAPTTTISMSAAQAAGVGDSAPLMGRGNDGSTLTLRSGGGAISAAKPTTFTQVSPAAIPPTFTSKMRPAENQPVTAGGIRAKTPTPVTAGFSAPQTQISSQQQTHTAAITPPPRKIVSSPFNLSSGNVRKGSPLPLQRTAAGTDRGRTLPVHPTVADRQARGNSPQAQRRVQRANSPQVQPSTTTLTAPKPTTHYVFSQGTPTGGAGIPHAQATVTTGGIRGSPISAVPGAISAGSGIRANSPTGVQRRANSPTGTGPRVATTPVSGIQRTNSPMAVPRGTSPGTGAGRNSPMRLADQYLSGGGSARVGRETNSSLLRRQTALR